MPMPPAGERDRSLEVAGVVHDVNQMLTAINGRVALLEAGGGGPDDLRAIALAAAEAAAVLRRLTGAPAAAGPAALRRCVDEAARLLPTPDGRGWTGEGAWTVVNEVPATAGAALPAQVLREVLCNLLHNALDATPGGGTVSVTAVGAGDRVRLVVADDGPGLAPGVAERIFDHGLTTRPGEGRGVGLAASRQLLAAWGAELDLARDGGPGAAFTLDLQKAAPPPRAAAPTDGEVSPPPVGRVLVVDDEAAVRDVLCEVLGSWNAAGVSAHGDAATARAVFLPGAHDLALVDLTLPGESGLDLARWLRARDPALAIVLMTGLDRARLLDNPEAAVADATVLKPLDFDQLRRLLATATETRLRAHDQGKGSEA